MPATIAESYSSLSCKPGTPLGAAKRCCHRLLKESHPDAVARAKSSPGFVEFEEERTKMLNAAYHLLKQHLGE